MNAKCIITIIIFWHQLIVSMAPNVLVWNLKLLSSNASTATLVANALKNSGIFLQGKGWWTTTKLLANVWTIAQKGEEIEKGNVAAIQQPTYGIGNVIGRLLTFMNSYCSKGEEFTPKDTCNFCNVAVEPEMTESNRQLASMVAMLHAKGLMSIGICNYDPLEYEIFAKKMAAKLCPLSKLFNVIIGVRATSENNLQANTAVDPLCNFSSAPDHYPRPSFIQFIRNTAATLAPACKIVLIDDPCNCSAVTKVDPTIVVKPFSTVEQLQRDLVSPNS